MAPEGNKLKKYSLGCGLILPGLLVYSLLEPFWIETKETVFVSGDIPVNFNGTKIVFIADIHHGPFFSRQRISRLVKRINNLHPDIILLGGDYIHRNIKYNKPCFEELKRLNAPMGKFGVFGNHDRWRGGLLCRKGMEYAGIVLLDNDARWLNKNGRRIKIGGVGDLNTEEPDISPSVKDTKDKDFVIVLSHNPDYMEFLTSHKVDLVLSGHTHGGQCTLFGWWAPVVPSLFGNKYRTGVIKTALSTVIVTNGIGTISPPLRFFARPQINVIYLYTKHNKM